MKRPIVKYFSPPLALKKPQRVTKDLDSAGRYEKVIWGEKEFSFLSFTEMGFVEK
jgi:hypothetical protein